MADAEVYKKHTRVVGEAMPSNVMVSTTMPVNIHVQDGQVVGIYPILDGVYTLNYQSRHVYITHDGPQHLVAESPAADEAPQT